MSRFRRHRGRVALLAFALLPLACGGDTSPPVSSIAAADLAARLQAGTAPPILDVRTPEEFAAGHLPGAINIPHDELEGRLGELDVDPAEPIVVHCRSGRRAVKAEAILEEAGYERIYDLEGHMNGWLEAGLPVE